MHMQHLFQQYTYRAFFHLVQTVGAIYTLYSNYPPPPPPPIPYN